MRPRRAGGHDRGLEGGNFFGYSLGHYYVFGDHHPGVTDVWEEFERKRHEVGYSPEVAAAARQERLGAKVVQEGGATGLRGAIGTPDQIREFLERYEEAGVDQLIFVLQAGRNRHEHIMESIEIFGREVLPAFKERDEKRQKEKEQRLAPVIDEVMARRERPDGTMPEDYVIRAIPKQMVEATGNEEGRKFIEKFAEDRAAGKRDEQLGILG